MLASPTSKGQSTQPRSFVSSGPSANLRSNHSAIQQTRRVPPGGGVSAAPRFWANPTPVAPKESGAQDKHAQGERSGLGETPVFFLGAHRLPMAAAPSPCVPMPSKLRVGAVDDPLEHEADRVADQVMSEPGVSGGALPRQTRQEPVASNYVRNFQRSSAVPQDSAGEVPAIVHDVLRSPGQALDSEPRGYFETRFGRNLPSVRIHSGGDAAWSAEVLSADAYTVGSDIVFGLGNFAPQTVRGRGLLAHELTHVFQQTGGAPVLQRAPKKKVAPPTPRITDPEAEAWYREMNVDDAFADPSPAWNDGDELLSDEALERSIEDSLHRSLSPEELHRQLLVRRAQPLGASAYQAANPAETAADMQLKIRRLQSKIRARKAKIAALKKQGKSAKPEIEAAKTEMSSFQDEVEVLQKTRSRLPVSTQFSRIGKGADAGTGAITYAGIQIETADGQRIALEFAETNATEHAEEAMIRVIESKMTKDQLRGSRVTVVGDQVVCGERCVPALTEFAERNGIESVDGIVFQRTRLNALPADTYGPLGLASPRTTLRTMTSSKSAGTEMVRVDMPIYRAPSRDPGGAAPGAGPSPVSPAPTAASDMNIGAPAIEVNVSGEVGVDVPPVKSRGSISGGPRLDVNIADYPPDGEGPIMENFHEGEYMRAGMAAVSGAQTIASLATDKDISLLGGVQWWLGRSIKKAAEDLDDNYPDANALWMAADLPNLSNNFAAGVAKMYESRNLYQGARIMAALGPANVRDAALKNIDENYAKRGDGSGNWQNYMDTAVAYREAIFALQERMDQTKFWGLPDMAANIEQRSTLLSETGEYLERTFYQLEFGPLGMFWLTYYELFELLHIAGVFKGLGGSLGSFAQSIRVRYDGYRQAWDELEASVQRVNNVTTKLSEQFHQKVPRSFTSGQPD